jgi:hypothetical protein
MFNRFRRVLGRLFDRSRTINNEPLNKMSLIVIIFVDLFILTNVFTGLDDISRWHLSPAQAHPCYLEWNGYQTQSTPRKDYDILRQAISSKTRGADVFDYSGSYPQVELTRKYQDSTKNKLGSISKICFEYAGLRDKIDGNENQKTVATIDR